MQELAVVCLAATITAMSVAKRLGVRGNIEILFFAGLPISPSNLLP
jgi:hypothetical protein